MIMNHLTQTSSSIVTNLLLVVYNYLIHKELTMNLPQLVQALYDTTSVNDADEQDALTELNKKAEEIISNNNN